MQRQRGELIPIAEERLSYRDLIADNGLPSGARS